VKLSTMALLTGLHMNQIMEFLHQMNIATASRSTFYNVQRLYVNSIIWQFWTEMRLALLVILRQTGRALTVTGDGQGYNANRKKNSYVVRGVVTRNRQCIRDDVRKLIIEFFAIALFH
jgi:hypothetical protein